MKRETQGIIRKSSSAILMAYPGAEIFHFDEERIEKVKFNDLEHVRLMRDFLNHPEAFLQNL